MNFYAARTGGPPLVRRRTGSSSLTTAIVHAVASLENEDPSALGPLGEAVDPEALERLLEGPDSAAHVTFSYADHQVVVTDDAVEVY